MGARQKIWARKARKKLLIILGGCCVKCGTEKKLTFDCIEPRGDYHHKKDTSARMCFYHKQYREGNLQILCSKHNFAKSFKDKHICPF